MSKFMAFNDLLPKEPISLWTRCQAFPLITCTDLFAVLCKASSDRIGRRQTNL